MHGKRCAALLALTALVSPTSAFAATGDNCATLALLATPKPDWSQLGSNYRKDGLIDLAVSGKSDRLTGFTTCELDGGDLPEVECSWKGLSQTEALSRFNLMKVAFTTCIKADFALTENSYASDGLRVLKKYAATIETDDPDSASVDVSIELMEFGDGDYWVDLDFQH